MRQCVEIINCRLNVLQAETEFDESFKAFQLALVESIKKALKTHEQQTETKWITALEVSLSTEQIKAIEGDPLREQLKSTLNTHREELLHPIKGLFQGKTFKAVALGREVKKPFKAALTTLYALLETGTNDTTLLTMAAKTIVRLSEQDKKNHFSRVITDLKKLFPNEAVTPTVTLSRNSIKETVRRGFSRSKAAAVKTLNIEINLSQPTLLKFVAYQTALEYFNENQGSPILLLSCLENVIEALSNESKSISSDNYAQLLVDLKEQRTHLLMSKLTNSDNNSVLHDACLTGNAEVARQCLQLNKYCQRVNKLEQTPLEIAYEKNNLALFNLLFTTDYNTNYRDHAKNSWLHRASLDGKLDWVKFLFENAPKLADDTNAADKTALQLAAENSHAAVVAYLLQHGCKFFEAQKSQGNSWLHLACAKGDLETVKLLFTIDGQHEDSLNHERKSPIAIAVENGHHEVVDFLIRKKFNYDLSLLHLAVEKNLPKVVAVLLKNNVDKDAINDKGYTSFHLACIQQNHEIANMLFLAGATIKLTTANEGHSALYLAVQFCELDYTTPLIEFLIKICKLSPDSCDLSSVPALHLACQRHLTHIVEFLLMNGANVDLLNTEGETALAVACNFAEPNITLINTLLQYDANPDLVTLKTANPAVTTALKKINGIIISTQTPVKGESYPRQGGTAHAIQQITGCPVVHMHRNSQPNPNEKFYYSNIRNGATVYITGHGGKRSDVVVGGYFCTALNESTPAIKKTAWELEKYVDLIVNNSGLNKGDHITLVLWACHGGVGNEKSMAAKLAQLFLEKNIHTTIIASEDELERFDGFRTDEKDQLRFRSINDSKVRVFKGNADGVTEYRVANDQPVYIKSAEVAIPKLQSLFQALELSDSFEEVNRILGISKNEDDAPKTRVNKGLF